MLRQQPLNVCDLLHTKILSYCVFAFEIGDDLDRWSKATQISHCKCNKCHTFACSVEVLSGLSHGRKRFDLMHLSDACPIVKGWKSSDHNVFLKVDKTGTFGPLFGS